VRKGNTGGRRLTFKSIRCPLCQAIIQHPSLNKLIAPQYSMYQKVRRKALQRWVVENRRPTFRSNDRSDEDRVAQLAMSKMMFFECCQCNEPYYGGEVECGGQMEDEQNDLDDDVQAALAMELVCRGCASKGQLQCPEHGVEFLGWKCRYCCEREAHYFCFGTTHFCYTCHDLWQTGVEQRRKLQAGKPCLGKDDASSAAGTLQAAGMAVMSTHSAARFVRRTRRVVCWSTKMKRARAGSAGIAA